MSSTLHAENSADPHHRKQNSYQRRIALAAGSLSALSLQATDVNAAIVHVTGSPVTLSSNAALGTEASWDVDGDSVRDFFLRRFDVSSYGVRHYIDLSSLSANGKGFVNASGNPNTADIQRLNTGFQVAPTLAAGYFFGTSTTSRNVLRGDPYPNFSIGLNPQGFTPGQDGYMGFAFESGGQTHYGWATLNIVTGSEGIVTIAEWAYESTPDAPIAVGAVPEPSSLALLALGAGGLAVWRRRKKQRAAAGAAPAEPGED